MKKTLSFPKEDKLKSRKMISYIFSDGFAVKSFPLRIQFVFHDLENFPPCQMGVSVPKRNFKKAVDRNRIKRQIREAYRLNRSSFIQRLVENQKCIALMVVFSGRDAIEYSKIESCLTKALDKIII